MINKEREFWNTKGKQIYDSGKFNDPEISNYEFEILERLKICSGSVLEIGPGSGRDTKKFIEMGFNASAIDISKHFIDELKNNFDGNFIEGDLRDINKYFKNIDLIYSRWSILFLQYDEFKHFLNNASSILNVDGHIMISLRYGNNLKNVHTTTKLQSLQLNTENLQNALPESLKIVFLEIADYSSSREKNDKQITFILKKESNDIRNNIYVH